MTLDELKTALKDLKISKVTSNKILNYFQNADEISNLNTVIYQERLANKHKMVRLESAGTRGYGMLFWIHPIIEQLVETYEMDYMTMARMYVKIGMQLMVRGYGINKFKYYNEDILNTIDVRACVGGDENKESTYRLFRYYAKKVYEIWGVELDVITAEDKYHVIKLRSFIKSRELNAKEWIDGRFEKYKKSKKPIPVYMLYAEKEENSETIKVKHSKLSKIVNS